MNILYKSSFVKICYSPSLNLMEVVWSPYSKNLFPALYRSEFLTFFKYQNICKAQNILVDERMFYYEIDDELEEWVNNTLKDRVVFFAKKVAIVANITNMRQDSIDQRVEKAQLINTQMLFFENKNAAKDFLIEEYHLDAK
ncbi:hypothetical protein [Chondrinema litorale]|uniref:hypothetical protein n=1 Tax=Chondrinema litorale TaxID=2994555 RepID=UPI002542C7F1|nr:hypothetical protein [Chondrinema litorale]UZR99567.1 hypothetical protein OQ292_37530 [Chondrinema litorale]